MDLTKAIPKGDHSEDWLIGNARPVGLGSMSSAEYEEVCSAVTEPSLAPIGGTDPGRSLVMVHPDSVSRFDFSVETSWEGQKRYQPRCNFTAGGRQHRSIAISDAEWRTYGRQIMSKHGQPCTQTGAAVFQELGAKDCWLTVGRNQVSGKAYCLVVGIHLFPPVRFGMDFKRA